MTRGLRPTVGANVDVDANVNVEDNVDAHWPRLRVAMLLLALGACDGQFGCLTCGEGFVYPDPPPPGGEVLDDALLGQVQERGIDFMAGHLSDILRARYPTRLVAGVERVTFYLPEATVGTALSLTVRDGCRGPPDPSMCPMGDETYRSRVELNLDTIDDAVDATFLIGGGDNRVRITLYDVDVFLDLALVIEAVGSDATCWVRDDADNLAAVHLDRVRFIATIDIDANDRLDISVSDVEMDIGFFDDNSLLNLDVSACNGALLCVDETCTDGILWPDFECVTLCGIGNFVFNAAEFLADLLSPVIEWLGPPLVETAVNAALDDSLNGTPLAIAGTYDLADLFAGSGSLSESVEFPTSIGFGAHPNSDAFRLAGPVGNRGMTLALDSGTFAPPSQCVPTVSPPNYTLSQAPAPFFDGVLTITDPVSGAMHTEAYHGAAVLSQAYANQLGYTFFTSGAECLVLGPDEILAASGGAFQPVLGTLALFAPGLLDLGQPDAPVVFEFHPTRAPRVRFGTGDETGVNSEGDPIVDSLLQFDFGEMGISVYVFGDTEYFRLTTVAADVTIGMTLVRSPRNTLEFALDSLAMTDVVQVYNEVARYTDFAELAEVMISIAVGGLLNNVGSLDLDLAPVISNLLGGAPVYGRINDVRRLGTDPDAGHLGVFVTMCDDDDLTNPNRPPCYTPPMRVAAPAPPRVHPALPALSADVHRVRLWVDDRYEYQTRVDGGAWSGFRRASGGVLSVRSPLLAMPGLHRLELRERVPGRYLSRGTETVLDVWRP